MKEKSTDDSGTPARNARAMFWPAIIALIFLSFLFALRWLPGLNLDSSFYQNVSPAWLSLAIITQLSVALLMIFAWQLNLHLHDLKGITTRQATVMIGINAIGKYSPGKVLGIAAKGGTLYNISKKGSLALQTTIVEQTAILHSGVAVAVLSWSLRNLSLAFSLLIIVVIFLSVLAMQIGGKSCSRMLHIFFKQKDAQDSFFGKSYLWTFLIMLAVWILSAFSLYACIASYHAWKEINFIDVLLTTTVSYLAGFIAFFTPAGLGARDAAMFGMLSLNLDLHQALNITILHRLITLIVDMILGGYALIYGKRLISNA